VLQGEVLRGRSLGPRDTCTVLVSLALVINSEEDCLRRIYDSLSMKGPDFHVKMTKYKSIMRE
jgi:hypothetical protein